MREYIPNALRSRWYLYLRHCQHHGQRHMPWWPKTFNQHTLWLMMGPRDSRRRVFGDKFKMRDFIEAKLGPGWLPELLADFADPEEFDRLELPEKFVLKPNHGSAMVRIVDDRSKLDPAEIKRVMRGWLDYDFGGIHREYPYQNVTPRIMVEELLEQSPGQIPYDYKLLCFAGKVRLIDVIIDRALGDPSRKKELFYDENWNRIPMSQGVPPGPDLPKPACLDEMKRLAYQLSKDFNFLRVDMYLLADRIVIGELTNFHDAGLTPIEPHQMDVWLGSFWPSWGWSARNWLRTQLRLG